eukprot:360788-Chlamydomonas_euryale.AAC.1
MPYLASCLRRHADASLPPPADYRARPNAHAFVPQLRPSARVHHADAAVQDLGRRVPVPLLWRRQQHGAAEAQSVRYGAVPAGDAAAVGAQVWGVKGRAEGAECQRCMNMGVAEDLTDICSACGSTYRSITCTLSSNRCGCVIRACVRYTSVSMNLMDRMLGMRVPRRLAVVPRCMIKARVHDTSARTNLTNRMPFSPKNQRSPMP